MDNRKSIKIFVTDYDNCLIDVLGVRKDMLDENLVTLLVTQKYTAGYGCTHRYYGAIKKGFLKAYMEKVKTYSESMNKSKKFTDCSHNPNNAYTTTVTENLRAILSAHKIEFLGVSTPDDEHIDLPGLTLGNRCGMAYSHVFIPYEAEIKRCNPDLHRANYIEPKFDTVHQTINDDQFALIVNSKNSQLLEIAHHARARFPDVLIEIHFFDDVLGLCESIRDIQLDGLPPNVSIASFLHNTNKEIHADLKNPIAKISTIPAPVVTKSVGWWQRFLGYFFTACVGNNKVDAELPKTLDKPGLNAVEIFSRGTSSAGIQKKLGGSKVVANAELSQDTLDNMAAWGDYQSHIDQEYSISRFTVKDSEIMADEIEQKSNFSYLAARN